MFKYIKHKPFDISKNIRIPFVLLIKRKSENLVRSVREDEMIFGEGSKNNVLMGDTFSFNETGNNCIGNVFFNEKDIIEIKNNKLTIQQRMKIAWKVFRRLKKI
jgi:glucosamine 6-phosphate synthetase-like amidotransferase/phosphosugar isomerase protein